MTKAEKTSVREAILLSGRALFWEKGMTKVTVEALCEHAQISKMSFYRNFKNKTEVLKTILMDFTNEGMLAFDKIMLQEAPFAKKLHEMMLFKQERSKGMNPLLVSDIYSKAPEIMAEFMAHSTQIRDKFEAALKAAKSNGELRPDINLDFLMYMVYHFNEKMLSADLLQIFDSMEDATHQLTEFFFYGILGTDPYA